MSNVKSSNPVVQNALGVWDNLMDIYLDRAATEGKMGDSKEAAYWFDKANTLRMIMKRADQTSVVPHNAEPYDGMVIDAYKKSFKDGLKKILEGISDIKVSKGRGIAHFDELKKRDKSFAETIEDLLGEEWDVRTLLGKM